MKPSPLLHAQRRTRNNDKGSNKTKSEISDKSLQCHNVSGWYMFDKGPYALLKGCSAYHGEKVHAGHSKARSPCEQQF